MRHDGLGAALWLAETLAAENAALRAMDLRAASACLTDKEAAAAALATSRAHPDRAAMQAAAARLRGLVEENRRLLERAIAVQGRVLGILAGAARTANPPGRYGRSGAYAERPNQAWALSARA